MTYHRLIKHKANTKILYLKELLKEVAKWKARSIIFRFNVLLILKRSSTIWKFL